VVLKGLDGSLLVRATKGSTFEQLEFGTFTVRGPAGSLFSSTRDLSQTNYSGDAESGTAALTSPDLALASDLIAAIAARIDADASLVAPLTGAPQRETEGVFGKTEQALALTSCGSSPFNWVNATCGPAAQVADGICGPAFWWNRSLYNDCMIPLLPPWCAGCTFVHI
jgi:hypothetical protein